MKIRKILKMYKPRGKNERPHIIRVLRDALEICGALKVRKKIKSMVIAAAALHDCAKNDPTFIGIDHGDSSAIKADKYLDGFSPKEADIIKAAISEHTKWEIPTSSLVSDILRAADSGKPSVGGYALKSYAYNVKKGLNRTEALKAVLIRLKEGRPVLKDKKFIPDSYEIVWWDAILEQQAIIESLNSPEELDKFMKDYTKGPHRDPNE